MTEDPRVKTDRNRVKKDKKMSEEKKRCLKDEID